jgi:hypothetical protein
MSRGTPQVQYALPALEPWHKTLLMVLFGAYVVELVLYNVGLPLYQWLPWYSLQGAFEVWQPLTRFVVQGAARGAVFDVLIGLVVLYFFLPAMEMFLDRATLLKAVLAAAVGGTLLPLGVDLLGLLDLSGAMGWTGLVMVLPVLFGLARPDQDILLLVFPVKARWFLWGTLVLALLYLLVEQSLDTFEGLGIWLGTVGWWYGLGPGARRRQLLAKSRDIERELHRFEVIEGGRDPQGGQRGPDDDVVH